MEGDSCLCVCAWGLGVHPLRPLALIPNNPPLPHTKIPPSQALFKGLGPNYVKVVPSIAIAFVTYEQVKEVLGAEIRLSD